MVTIIRSLGDERARSRDERAGILLWRPAQLPPRTFAELTRRSLSVAARVAFHWQARHIDDADDDIGKNEMRKSSDQDYSPGHYSFNCASF